MVFQKKLTRHLFRAYFKDYAYLATILTQAFIWSQNSAYSISKLFVSIMDAYEETPGQSALVRVIFTHLSELLQLAG